MLLEKPLHMLDAGLLPHGVFEDRYGAFMRAEEPARENFGDTFSRAVKIVRTPPASRWVLTSHCSPYRLADGSSPSNQGKPAMSQSTVIVSMTGALPSKLEIVVETDDDVPVTAPKLTLVSTRGVPLKKAA